MKANLHVLSFSVTLACSLFSVQAAAKETRYNPYPLEIATTDRLVVSLAKGTVKLIPLAPGKTPSLSAKKVVGDKASAEDLAKFEQLSFVVRRDANVVSIETKGPDTKEAWAQWMKAGSPELVLEIEAPVVPAEIWVREGAVSAQNWKESLMASVVTGSVKTAQTEGALRVGIQRGEVKIEKHRGPAEVDSYGAKLTASEIEGDLDLSNFGGESTLTQVKGTIGVRTHAGGLAINKSSGSVDFMTGRGGVQLAGFEGPVRGQTDQGNVSAQIEGEAEVNIESNQGIVSVKLPSDSGATVRLQTEEGSLALPEAVRAPASAQQKVFSSRLEGDGPKGSVQAKSKSGTVRLRF